jgi:hypothetical protein
VTAWALVSLLAFGQSPTETQSFLHAMTLDSQLEGPIDWAKTELVVTEKGEAVATAAFITRRKVKPVQGQFVVRQLDHVLATDAPLPRHRQPSWVMDYDQKAFASAFEAAKEQPATAEGLTKFVAGYLTRKGYDRGFDLASQVATRRGGDCTEHAVFLASMLRHAGIPARGVIGLVLIPSKGRPLAFGHMWTEAWVDGAWRIADAAIPSELHPAYLPAGELTDEGPGYTMSLFKQLNTLSYEHLELRATK